MTSTPRAIATLLLLVACRSDDAAAIAGDVESSSAANELESSSSVDPGSGSSDGSESTGSPPDELPVPQGREIWRRSLGPGRASAVAALADGRAVVVGVDDLFGGRAWAVMVDEQGAVQWKRMLEQPDGHAEYTDVAIGSAGEVWVVGWRAVSILGPAFSIVLERLDPATGDVVWSDPGQDVTVPAWTGAALQAVVALPDGVLVAGQRTDDASAQDQPTLWRYDRDGALLWATSWSVVGRAYDVALVDDAAVLVGSTFEPGDYTEPLGAWAGIATLDGEFGAQPSLPSGPAELRLAVASTDGSVWAVGSRGGLNDVGFHQVYGGMLSIAVTGELRASVDLPPHIEGAALADPDELVLADDSGRVRSVALDGQTIWQLNGTVAIGMPAADAVTLAADGNVLVAGGYDAMELAKIAAPR